MAATAMTVEFGAIHQYFSLEENSISCRRYINMISHVLYTYL